MKGLRRLTIVVPAVALALLLLLLFLYRGTMEQLAFMRRGGEAQSGLVDQTPYGTARTLAGEASSAEEQSFAEEAERLADHEVDQAFAMALRQASLEQSRTPTGEAARLAGRVSELRETVKTDQAAVDGLQAAAKANGTVLAEGDELDVAKAQLQLDTDELADATEDLQRASGDQRARIQAELQAREEAMKKAESAASGKKSSAVAAVRKHATLWGRGAAWVDQRTRAHSLAAAESKARADAGKMAAEHDRTERQVGQAVQAAAAATGTDRVGRLRAMATRRSIMSILDDRAETDRELAGVYGHWQQQVWAQHRILAYLIGESLAVVLFLLLLTTLARSFSQRLVDRMIKDPRQAHTLRTVLTLGVEIAGLLAVLVVVFGVPEQISTILGLVTAGLTVVFQDFILAFCGWFILMGKNGIRVSDWVEIQGIGGEVAEIGLFRTVLLEAGNWTSSGHPTGRRVPFSNSFAIQGKYFNFSTHGQWMWDEITVNVPANAGAYALIPKIQGAVEKETATDSSAAEREWHKVASDVGLSQFSARPTVELRPAATGVDVVVRFVTRASERFGARSRIYEALVGLMEGTERANGLPPIPMEDH